MFQRAFFFSEHRQGVKEMMQAPTDQSGALRSFRIMRTLTYTGETNWRATYWIFHGMENCVNTLWIWNFAFRKRLLKGLFAFTIGINLQHSIHEGSSMRDSIWQRERDVPYGPLRVCGHSETETTITREFGPWQGILREIGTRSFWTLCGIKRNLTSTLKKCIHVSEQFESLVCLYSGIKAWAICEYCSHQAQSIGESLLRVWSQCCLTL